MRVGHQAGELPGLAALAGRLALASGTQELGGQVDGPLRSIEAGR
jgi:hypothetical protein